MTAVLDAIARVFVAPDRAEVRAAPVSAVAPPSAAVCGPDAQVLACALALLLRRRGPVVVCAWRSEGRWAGALATAGARRLAGSMAARGLAARATGRLVVVELDVTPAIASAEAARAAAAAGDAPVVMALCGARDPVFDGALAAQDVAVVAAGDAPQELVRLSVAALEATSRRAVTAGAPGAVAAWAARAGLWVAPDARRALGAATAALR
jgi:hypothetical protein